MEAFRRAFYSEYTDLACERRRADLSIPGVSFEEDTHCQIRTERIRIETEEGAEALGRPIGRYETLHCPALESLDDVTRDAACEMLCDLLLSFREELTPSAKRILVCGLGNEELTPDAVGALAAMGVHATMHIAREDRETFEALGCHEIAVITPGVTSQTGLESAESIQAAAKCAKPDLVILIDALAAASTDRLGKTVQVASSGLLPGHAIGNRRMPITEQTLGVPVISIGVPTVTDARAFFEEHAERAGFLGRMYPEKEEVLYVCPKDIRQIVGAAASIISEGINRAFGICF